MWAGLDYKGNTTYGPFGLFNYHKDQKCNLLKIEGWVVVLFQGLIKG